MTDYGTKQWKEGEKEILSHQDTDMRALCWHDFDAYKRIKSECNSKLVCQARPLPKDKEQFFKSPRFLISQKI